MHYLTGIIIESKDELTNQKARDRAREILDEFEYRVWDWYNDSPGRWSDEYGEGVFKATNPIFHKTVKSLIDSQKTWYRTVAEKLKDIDYYKKVYESGDTNEFPYQNAAWYLGYFAQCVSGEFTSESYIYDAEKGTAFITNNMLEEYHDNPDIYYLVLFDVHN